MTRRNWMTGLFSAAALCWWGTARGQTSNRSLADAVANAERAFAESMAKRDLAAGEMLDGEGGETVWGQLMPAAAARTEDALPIGLAHRVRLRRGIRAGARIGCADVALDPTDPVVKLRAALIPTSD